MKWMIFGIFIKAKLNLKTPSEKVTSFSGLRVEALRELLSADLVNLVPSFRPQQDKKATISVVGILNDPPSLILAANISSKVVIPVRMCSMVQE